MSGFYLNIIVLDHMVPQSPSRSSGSTDQTTGTLAPTLEEMVATNDALNLAPAAEESSNVGTPGEKKKKLLKGLDKSYRTTMRGLTMKSTAVGNKAAAFVASKTMVSRALSCLNKSLPDIVAAGEELQVTIGKRFNQGKVIVLHVSLKAANMSRYIEEVQGEDAAEHYRCAISTLKLLGATSTMKNLEDEMFPQVRQGLMDKVTDLLVSTMKEKEGGLEIECIALEEAEEARWLFTFMEFQEQMKK